jgi:hypothetical protein
MSDTDQHVSSSEEHAAEPPLPAAIALGQRQDAQPAPSPHAHKFRTAMALLVGLAIGAVAVAAALLVNGSSAGSTQKWSDWSPIDNGIQGAEEIANHLAPFYRISGVDQLAVVTVINLGNPNDINPTTGVPQGLQVAIRTGQSAGSVSLLNGKTVAFNLCGIGTNNCTIGSGKPSSLRLLLLRREALELALYTFKYISGISNVVAILPPGHTTEGCGATGGATSSICASPHPKPVTKQVTIALLFLHDELQPFLDQPLAETLPEEFPPSVPQLPLWSRTTEAGLVEQITARGLFSEQLVNAQDGSHLVVLSQQPPS